MSVEQPTHPLVDGFGRVATDLRVSVTDRCNLRCSYCMPAEGLPWIAGGQLLTDDELVRLMTVAIRLNGIRTVRFTGGEPLLRPGLDRLIAAADAAGAATAVTTNGVLLAGRSGALAQAGLRRVNVSLDSISAATFLALSKRDKLDEVLRGLATAYDAGLRPVKVNAVLVRGINDHEAVDLLAFCLDRGYELRFIEQMPLDPMHVWDRGELVTADEILERLSERYELRPEPIDRAGAPAETFLVDGGPARVGIIGSVTRPFCGACDRTRLTADGQVRNCLFAVEESDLRGALRDGAGDEELARRWQVAMAGKAAGHGVNTPRFRQPVRPMSAIGG